MNTKKYRLDNIFLFIICVNVCNFFLSPECLCQGGWPLYYDGKAEIIDISDSRIQLNKIEAFKLNTVREINWIFTV